MNRYRLRFLLQEVDLPSGETVIGRSSSCQITLDDPLVSRRHATIRIGEDGASIEDLGSRNGSFVGPLPIEGKLPLNDGDRIRIGALEMVFCLGVDSGRPRPQAHQITGFLCRCTKCGQPYTVDLPECPACGSEQRQDEQTLSGARRVSGAWTLELSAEVLAKAVQLGRWEDAERVLVRLRTNLEELLAAADKVDRSSLDQVAAAIGALCAQQQTATWGRWILSMYAVLGFVPPIAVPEHLLRLPEAERKALLLVVERVLSTVREGRTSNPLESRSLELLRSLASADPKGAL